MKYALVFAFVLAVFWLWRSNRSARVSDKKQDFASPKQTAAGKATEMVACRVCHVHLPLVEALTDSRGTYCSAEHRQQAGD
jgi:uncharacterized protein